MNDVQVIAGAIVTLWLLGTAGYAVARARPMRIVLAESLYLDDGNDSIRLEIRCEGFGEITPSVVVVGLWDEDGKSIEATAVRNFPLHWIHRKPDAEVILKEDGLPSADVTVFYRNGSHFCLYNDDGHRPLNAGGPTGVMRIPRIRVRVRAYDPKCEPVERDYWIEEDVNCKTGYRRVARYRLLRKRRSCNPSSHRHRTPSRCQTCISIS